MIALVFQSQGLICAQVLFRMKKSTKMTKFFRMQQLTNIAAVKFKLVLKVKGTKNKSIMCKNRLNETKIRT